MIYAPFLKFKFRFDELFTEQFVVARRPQADVAIP